MGYAQNTQTKVSDTVRHDVQMQSNTKQQLNTVQYRHCIKYKKTDKRTLWLACDR